MATTALRSEERIGLVAAIALHAGLAAVLLMDPPKPPLPSVPERIEVTLSDEAGLTATSPEPDSRPAPDIAPQLGEPQPAPAEASISAPAPAPVPRPAAAPSPTPKPMPVASPPPPPAADPPKADPKPRRTVTRPFALRAEPVVPQRRDGRSTSSDRRAAQPSRAPAGRSRVGEDFLEGVTAAGDAAESRNAPAAVIGPAVRSSLASSISRQLKPYWAAPQGADAELLVTVLAFDLNPDGSLDGPPRVVRQSGITDANRAQAERHAEQAIRAVELAAPFDLPEEYYDAWERVSSFRFDKRLSQ